jgi:hypothetical protein
MPGQLPVSALMLPDAVNRQSWVTAQVGQQFADAHVPGLACLGGVHR